ncbi:sulfatase [Saccharicrinis aurantiacus]|uniref:sulfatase n=1 Tax=Saccharicrinis aurantiacus TaxID=1849719 RepID=UPI002490E694|nr:sulfatase [Saccharicrinis aurantiacus]
MNKIFIAALALMGLVSCNNSSQKTETKAPEKPNVVFIVADDLGYADLACTGSDLYETPNLDELAANGVRFSDGYAACQVCSPSRVSLQTGQFPARHGVTTWIGDSSGEDWRAYGQFSKLLPPEYEHGFSNQNLTWAKAMKKNGYKTFFAGKWHAGDVGSTPEDHGFDINIGGWEVGGPKGGYFDPFINPKMENRKPGENLSMRLADETVSFLKANKDEPFFAFLSFYAVHGPIQTSEEKWSKYRKKILAKGVEDEGFVEDPLLPRRKNQDHPVYAGLVETMDDAVGVVLEGLKELGLDENTIVIFTSDNGGVTSGDGYSTSNAPLKGGKGQAYEGGIRIPYIISVPWMDNHGTWNSTPASGVDFYPTVLDLVNAPLEPKAHADGISLKPALMNQKMDDRPLYWHYPHYGNQGGDPASMVRQGNWKLLYFWDDQHIELYNLAEDIGENNDLSKQNTELTEQLKAQLFGWLESVHAKYPKADPQYDDAKRKAYVKRRMRNTKANLEKQRTDMYKEDWKPNKDWWGSMIIND